MQRKHSGFLLTGVENQALFSEDGLFLFPPPKQAISKTPFDVVYCCRRVLVQGAGPSARYAHTLSLVANRFLVAMGGNDGKSTLGDAWALDTSEKPYQWRKITEAGEMPSPR